MPRQVELVATNPNDVSGGGGCACSSVKTANQEGPFLVFPLTEMDHVYSPHNVVCVRCAEQGIERGRREGVLAGGETSDLPVESTAVEELVDTAESVQADALPEI